MINIFPINALNDNYIWVIANSITSEAAIVDPGEAEPVLKYLAAHNLKLTTILITHHHHDHTGGIKQLLEYATVPVIMPNSVSDGESVFLTEQQLTLQVMKIPGHTLDHIAYYNNDYLFCGDTLFAAGCGRVFEGTYLQMYDALQKFKQLAPNTQVYCAHEYTMNNLLFAAQIAPEDLTIQQRLMQAMKLRADNLPTLPSTIQQELETNLFLCAKNLEEFVALRKLKDKF